MLEIRGLTLAYGTHVVVEELDLRAADGEVLCVLGPSGCGKSTLLRAVAGLEQPVHGSIHLDGRDVTTLRPDQRRVGLMFQEHALFPHRSVADNVGFGPRMQGLERTVIAARTAEALALVGLTGTEHRRVDQLSGGERQRVALARAVAPRPRLLMLDEPLGSLDRALRTRLLEDLPRVFSELGTTVVYVTHDQDEALALADRVAVMRAGRLLQEDTPARLWRSPRTTFVASFLGLDQQVPVTVTADRVVTPFGEVPRAAVSDAGAAPGDGRAVLLPEAVRLAGAAQEVVGPGLTVGGRVVAHRFRGDHLQVEVAAQVAGDHLLRVIAVGAAPPEPGSEVTLLLDPAGLHLLAVDGDG